MNLEDAIALLKSKSLYIKRLINGPHKNGLMIGSEYEQTGEIGALNDITFIYPDANGWVFDTHTGVPYPLADEVTYSFPTLDLAIEATIQRYFGNPIILQGWIFPIHKHPDWKSEQLERCVKQATHIHLDEWLELKKEFSQKLAVQISLDRANWFQHPELDFRVIKHDQNPSLELWINRNLSEAYLVT